VPADLRAAATRGAVGWKPRLRHLGLAASLVVVMGIVLVRAAQAGDVMLHVGVLLNDQKIGQRQLVAPEGKSAEFEFEGHVKLFVNPIVTQDGSILLSMRVEAPSGSRWVEMSEPRMLVGDGTQATVRVTSPGGRKFEIAVRPHKM